jgi:hypothetical protein
MLKKGLLLLIFLSLAGTVGSQQLKNDEAVLRMKKDVYVLSADSMEGREAGKKGEVMAAEYISHRFEMTGLEPYFEDYYQHFNFTNGYAFSGKENYLTIIPESGETFHYKHTDYQPMPWGGEGAVTADIYDAGYGWYSDISLRSADHRAGILQNKIWIIKYGWPDSMISPPKIFSIYSRMGTKVNIADSLGAAGVIFVSDTLYPEFPGNAITALTGSFNIPVIFVNDTSILSRANKAKIKLGVKKEPKHIKARNVVGWINNKAAQTVIIGAHYDHLGYGGGTSRSDGTPEIHNGADDNASGVAAIIELASWITKEKLKNKNYIFIAFSAEEKGLVGSKHFAALEAIDSSTVFCMLNFDMIGRLDESGKTLNLLAAGSSPQWEQLAANITTDIEVKIKKAGISGSDHAPFIKKSIPALFFFSGIHDDYHKPGDDCEKLNYYGMHDIVEYAANMIRIIDTMKNMIFSAVVETTGRSNRTDMVTLGIVPDHGATVDGLKISDVIQHRPAYAAGLKSGDIIIQIDDTEVHDIMQYMKALGTLKKGTKSTVVVKRNNEIMSFVIYL